MKEFIASNHNKGVRVDVFLADNYPQFSRSALSGLFDKRMVSVDGELVRAGYKLKGSETVKVDESLLRNVPGPLELPILYEDGSVLVIDKPEGVLTHAKGALNTESTVASFIKPALSDNQLTGNRAGIVHRLDRGTSGVIITAKTKLALSKLQKQFSTRKVKKTYLAIVEGIIDPPEAVIDAPVGRHPKRPQTFRVDSLGKTAITEYRLIKTFKKDGQNYSLIELKPKTGRTHQIRVHMAYIGHPIVGDPVYGQPAEHIYLHAQKLEITLPSSERKTFSADLPAYFKEFVNG
ncbi:MAG TPA: RluA family pseudouridine synthase [Candidatus Saccharimonadales bacterium]|nr:RluA family pseudouridine synthase [Candidatus Saccharimonadales bacterium]